jgi:hypothetical protein
MNDRLKGIGSVLFGLGAMLAFVAVITVFIKGAVWGEHVLQWLVAAAGLVFLIDLLVLLPLAIFRRTRPWAGLALYISSFVFGLTSWFVSLLQTYELWGLVSTILGLLFWGLGVVPMGFLATLFKGMWPELFWMTFYIVMTFGTRYLGALWVEAGRKEASEEVIVLD